MANLREYNVITPNGIPLTVMLSPEDAKARGLTDKDRVKTDAKTPQNKDASSGVAKSTAK